MLLRRYGTTFQSVDLNFDSRALNEIGFRRNRETSIPAEEFERSYERVHVEELTAEVEGDVQDETEQQLLDVLESRIREMLAALEEDEVLVVENEQGHDYPKTRQKTTNVIVEGENRLRFTYTVAPPLRIGRYRRIA